MWRVPILSQSEEEACEKDSLRDLHSLPDFYMSDYTVLGIAIDGVDKALRILAGAGYTLDLTNPAYPAEVVLGEARLLDDLFALLRKNGINYTFGDVIDSVYQG